MKVDILTELGYNYVFSQPDSAVFHIQNALKLAKGINYTKGMADAHNRMANYYSYTSNYPKALKHVIQAIRLYEKVKDIEGLSRAYASTGVLEFYLQDYESSVKNFKKGVIYANKLDNNFLKSIYYTNISGAYREKGNLDSALVYGSKALELNRDNLESRHYPVILFNIGSANYKMGNIPASLKLLDKAIAHKNIPRQFLLLSKIFKAKAYLELGSIDNARQQMLNLEQEIIQLGDRYVLSNYYETASLLFEKDGESEKAVAALRKYISNNDEVYSNSKNALSQKYRILFEIERSQIENGSLKEKNKITEKQIYKQRIGLWIIGGLSIVLLVTLIILFNLYRHKKRTNSLLKENQRVLNRTNKDLKAINTQKNSLFSIVAHDVKSPISNLLQSINLLRDHPESFQPGEIKMMTTELSREISDLFVLIQSVLTWARSQMEGYQFEKSNVFFAEVIEEILQITEHAIEKKNLTITNKFSEKLVLQGDRQAIELIMRNLVQNAIKFTPNNGTITIGCEMYNGQHRLYVSDTGIGIAEKHINQIFVKKERYTRLGTNDEAGNGIGLILCNEIAKKIGGGIEVESTVGKGSTFSFIV
ncbi:MAG: ATP-binding protein [Leeuwenhoekiella sp.]